jgi:hypothetical protein
MQKFVHPIRYTQNGEDTKKVLKNGRVKFILPSGPFKFIGGSAKIINIASNKRQKLHSDCNNALLNGLFGQHLQHSYIRKPSDIICIISIFVIAKNSIVSNCASVAMQDNNKSK